MPRTKPNPRVKFQTKDGILVMNRELQYGEGAHDVILMLAHHDARVKGVRILSHEFDEAGMVATVEWLKGR